ncbi:glycine--tRNA ligase [Halobacteriales archaeon QS_5_70_15]|nr:MAG: glycine--tRNA ligase [Halobacteriales archaeon QS_5_70_15]
MSEGEVGPEADGVAVEDELRTVAELATRRGFFFPAIEAYGGVAGFYTYGPQGAALKRNVEEAWRDRFVTREGHVEISAPDVLPEPVFEASGHLDGFDDTIVECPSCGASHRADHLVEDATDIADAEALPIPEVEALFEEHDLACPNCGESLAGVPVEEFNLMFETSIGPGSGQPGYLRPETAQGIFVEFPRLKEYARNRLPFAVAQVGTAWRNEISPRRSLVRVREFTQAELEHFIDPETDEPPIERVKEVELTLYPASEQTADDGDYRTMTVGEAAEDGVVDPWIAYYLGVAGEWYESVGVDMDRFRYRQHLGGELAHYATDCWDAEAELGGNWVEITGFGYRSDYDLSKHDEYSDEAFTVFRQYDEPRSVERATVDPDMSTLGPEYGGAAADIADALADLAERDPSAFDAEEVTVEVGGESYTVPTEVANFSVGTVTESGEHVTPHVVEPSFGIGRIVYTVLVHAYERDVVDDEQRTYLDLPARVAPTTVGVFPLMARDGLDDRARELAADLREAGFDVEYDDSGNIGRRYRRQDEVGTPYCVTVDYETLEDGTVTVRERDSTEQARVEASALSAELTALRTGAKALSDL